MSDLNMLETAVVIVALEELRKSVSSKTANNNLEENNRITMIENCTSIIKKLKGARRVQILINVDPAQDN